MHPPETIWGYTYGQILEHTQIPEVLAARTAQAQERPQSSPPTFRRGAICAVFRADAESGHETGQRARRRRFSEWGVVRGSGAPGRLHYYYQCWLHARFGVDAGIYDFLGYAWPNWAPVVG
eukprot:13619808-Alexandrium_andersonii.AAC.1